MQKIAIIGLGLIGSSIAYSLKNNKNYIVNGYDNNSEHRKIARKLGFCDKIFDNIKEMVIEADIIILATPVSTYSTIVKNIAKSFKLNAILTDVGSVKQNVIKDVNNIIGKNVFFVPAHPISGSEKSGPNAGIKGLFKDRYVIITPVHNSNNSDSITKIKNMWKDMGAIIEIMDPYRHDIILAITSHIPHILAFVLVDTAKDLENKFNEVKKIDVIKYSAGGFRDATRVAASDPIMWRDILIENKNAVLEILKYFESDLQKIKTALYNNDGEFLQNLFTRTREIRNAVIEMKQDKFLD